MSVLRTQRRLSRRSWMRHLACAVALLASAAGAATGQEKTITPPATIIVEGMPPIPQSIADDLVRYAQFRQAQMMAWNPARRQMLVTTTLAGTVPQLYSVDGPGRDRHQLTGSNEGFRSSFTSRSIPADANTVVFRYDPTGSSELRSRIAMR